MNIFKTFFIFVSVMGIISCNPNSKSDDNETLALLALAMPQTVNLNFEALANGQPLVTGSNITADIRTVQFRDFRMYISEVKLVKADGSTVDVTLSTDNVWQSNGVALVDLETTQTVDTNTKVSGTAPAGSYTGVQFTVGVPEALNHLDRTNQAAPLNNGAMYWSWTGGYKHSKIEFSYNNGTDWTSLHIGSTTCSGAPNYGNCSKKFRASIQLTGQFNSANQKISLDVDKLINGHTFGAMGMCMPGDGSAACLPLIRAFGLNESNGAADGTYSQRIFSLK
ncbi:putative repeat protein (TIGR04052 family) [Leptospira meyeri]|uniref:Putative repeat protein (TIGR04052 family) n=1 Tax=Leptospira meyeri TaxID=29508 RepID=A0A4R8MVW6_LEPME|nr:MbnP family copper-binding protein [Leptospira meyeri]EKJ86806.1 AZL_007920/MXAN_0976 family protein [Leptospira meyeri serovar Hardjo str. Went 5]TDY73573.1 putative repeat protein (TIGR04052 family) [Leptospira meyeri]